MIALCTKKPPLVRLASYDATTQVLDVRFT
jgi:hypothetical protein